MAQGRVNLSGWGRPNLGQLPWGLFLFVPCAELGSGQWASEAVKKAETTLGLLAI